MRTTGRAMLVVAVATAVGVVAGPASAAAPPTSRLEGAFDVQGKITKSIRIQGEKKGDKFTRTWTFVPKCATGICSKIRLTRSLKDGSTEKLDLKWDGKQYKITRTQKFSAPCGGKTVKKAHVVKFVLTAKVAETADRKGVPVSTKITGTVKADHKVTCPGGVLKAYHVSSATGTRSDPPAAPVAAFSTEGSGGSIQDGSNTVEFFDESEDPDGGPIAAWHWDFGDGTTSTEPNPVHTYNSAGTYTVTLTVTDENDGKSASTQQSVTIDP